MENQLEICKKDCAEKAAEITSNILNIEKLERNLKDAKEEIASRVNELELRGSELATLNKQFLSASSDIEERNKTIEVTLYFSTSL